MVYKASVPSNHLRLRAKSQRIALGGTCLFFSVHIFFLYFIPSRMMSGYFVFLFSLEFLSCHEASGTSHFHSITVDYVLFLFQYI